MAKLIDILARELKVWPKFRRECIQSGEDSEIYFDGGSGDDLYVTERAEDGGLYGAVVTRAEWQAAVDALNALSVWDGKGIPPADTVCEFNSNWAHAAGGSTWHIVTVVFSSAESYVVRRNSAPEGETMELCGPATGFEISRFRPIHTAEQVAAEEREKSVSEALSILPGEVRCKAVVGQAIQIMIDAGYRKP